MKDLVQYLAKSLVNNPDAVEVNETTSDGGSVFEIQSRQGRLRTDHRQARPHRQIDPHAGQRRGHDQQPQSRPRNRRRKVARRRCRTPMAEPFVPLGEIVTTHGLDGWLKLNPFNPDTTALVSGSRSHCRKSRRIDRSMSSKPANRTSNQLLIKLRGVDSIDDAALWSARLCSSAEAALEALEPGQYYHYQVVGFEVFSAERRAHRHDLLDAVDSAAASFTSCKARPKNI